MVEIGFKVNSTSIEVFFDVLGIHVSESEESHRFK